MFFSENVDLNSVDLNSVHMSCVNGDDIDKFQTEKYPRPGQTAEIIQTDGAFDSSILETIRETEEDNVSDTEEEKERQIALSEDKEGEVKIRDTIDEISVATEENNEIATEGNNEIINNETTIAEERERQILSEDKETKKETKKKKRKKEKTRKEEGEILDKRSASHD